MVENSEKKKPVLIAINKNYLQVKKLSAMIKEVRPSQTISVGEETEVLQQVAKEMTLISKQ